jgi:hypothetical protein
MIGVIDMSSIIPNVIAPSQSQSADRKIASGNNIYKTSYNNLTEVMA